MENVKNFDKMNDALNDIFANGSQPYHIDYERSYGNLFGNDIKSAVKFYLRLGSEVMYPSDKYAGFVLYPQALNPFLRIMETMGEARNIIILPGFDQETGDKESPNRPAYLIIKVPSQTTYPTDIAMGRV